MLASELMTGLRKALHDPDGVRWNDEDLLDLITRAQRHLVMLRPDASSVVERVTLETGSTRQDVPDQGRFIGLVRNVNGDGTPGMAITPVDRNSLDEANLAWHGEPPSSVVDNYAFEEEVPTVFWVSPAPAAGVRVELEYSRRPPKLESVEQELIVPDIFSDPLEDYVLYRCWARSNSSPSSWQKGMDALRQMYVSLGEEAKARLLISPNSGKVNNG
ncbi:DUF6682 family protein [Maridesulfovibrio sp.]|uniref:phage adaptor protein n=1 Tax=Maridesulfovibrio sp. TaxID=2795000 RepID=UPI002AA60F69|nr:DUF6682 family protein [Maridesulfovibrio sp.]